MEWIAGFSNWAGHIGASGGMLASVSSELGLNPLFERWEGDLFKKGNWEQAMIFVRVALSAFGALLLLYEVRARKMKVRIPERTRKRVAIVFTVIAFLTYFDFFNPNVRYLQYYHRHEFYHYYLGSKYFKEVGYQRLYECTAVAEIDNGRRANIAGREIRDLSVNLIKPTKDTYVLTHPEKCKKHFTPERWEAFRKDVDWFEKAARGTYWENMQKDHGYNPPPVWTMAGKFFGSFGPASDGYFKVLASIDILFQLGAVLLLYWAFGWRVMAIATVFWGTNRAADFYWTGGAFMRQDWIFLLVASVCLARKRKFVLSGAALTWSALLRVFPAVLFFGWGVIILFGILKRYRERTRGEEAEQALALSRRRGKKAKKRPPPKPKKKGWLSLVHPDHQRLIAGCVVAMGTLVPLSIAVTGPNSYRDFIRHTMTVHRNTPLTNHMGIDTILTHTWDGRMRFTRDDNLDDPFQVWKQGRLDRKEALKPLRLLILVSLMLWIAWALRRTKLLWVGPPMSLVLVMALTDLTCYYYSLFLLIACLTRQRPPLGPTLVAMGGASAILLYNGPNTGFYFVDDRFTVQAYLFLLMALMTLYSYSRPFSMERLRAWWHGKPEPKSPHRESPPPGQLKDAGQHA